MMGQYAAPDTNPSCQRLVGQPPQFNSSNVPPFQGINGIPPELAQYTPAMAISIANALNTFVQSQHVNPAFIYAFNVVATSRWSGQLWYNMVNFGVMMLWYTQMQKKGVHVENLIAEAANNTVLLEAASLAYSNQSVMAHCDHATQNGIVELVKSNAQMQQEFQRMLQGFANEIRMANNPAEYARQVGGLAGAALGERYSQPNQPRQVSPGDYYSPASNNPYGLTVKTDEPVQGTAQKPIDFRDVMMKSQESTTYATEKKRAPWGSDAYFEQLEQEQEQQAKEEPPPVMLAPAAKVTYSSPYSDEDIFYEMDTPNSDPTEVTEDQWRPTEGQYFRPAVCADYWKLAYSKVSRDGEEVVVAYPVFKEDQEMQEHKHQIPTLNMAVRFSLEELNKKPIGDVINTDLDLLVQGMTVGKVEEDLNRTEKLKTLGIDFDKATLEQGEDVVYESLQALIAEATTQKLISSETPTVFMVKDAVVKTTLVFKAKDYEFAKKLRETHSMESLYKTLSDLMEQATKTEPLDGILYERINRFIADKIEYALRYRLGIRGAKFGNFLKFYQSLGEDLQKGFGVAYSNAWREFEAVLHQDILNGIQDEEEYTREEGKTVSNLFLTTQTAVVLLNMESSEFGVEIKGDEVFEILQSNFPGLHDFINAATSKLKNVERIYVVTLDKVYSVNRSIISPYPPVIFDEGIEQ